MVVLVTHINLVVVPMESPFNKGHMVMVVIALKRNSSAVQMELPQQQAKTLKDVHVQLANMDVAPMVLPMHKDLNSMDALIFQQHHRKHVALAKMVALAVIIPLNTSLIWNMEVAHDFGTADAVVMPIDSKQLKNVRAHANSQLVKMHVKFQRYTAHVLDTIRNITMTQTEILVHNSFMAVAWVILIDSKHWKNARVNVL